MTTLNSLPFKLEHHILQEASDLLSTIRASHVVGCSFCLFSFTFIRPFQEMLKCYHPLIIPN